MHRFCTPFTHSSSEIEITDSAEIHHLKNVLRLKKKDKLTIFNGAGIQAKGIIENLSKKSCRILIKDIEEVCLDHIQIVLACAMPKKGKFETIIEKATELGVAEIIPLKTSRTEVGFKGGRALKKTKRYETVALNAAKQCERADIPVIGPVSSLQESMKSLKKDFLLVMPGLVKPRKNFTDLFPLGDKIKKIAVFIGPEGDFTDEEYALAQKEGAHIVSLGRHVLKVETAALTAVSFIRLMTQQ